MIRKVSDDFWCAATALLLLLSIATHGLRPVDLDFDLDPAPFSAYDDDIIRASLGPGRESGEFKAVTGVAGGTGQLPPPSLEIDFIIGAQLLGVSSGTAVWLVSSTADAIRGTGRSPYRARGPPTAKKV